MTGGAAPASAPAPGSAAAEAEAAALRDWDGVSLEAWPELKAAAERELGETTEAHAAKPKELRAKLMALPEADRPRDMSDATLLRYLRGRKFRVDEAVKVMVAAHRFEAEHPEWLSNLRGDEFRAMYAAGFMRVLRGRDRAGRRVSLLLPMRFPEQGLEANTMMRWNFWSMRRLARCPYLQVHGACVYENFEVFSFAQAMKFNSSMPPAAMRANFHYMQKCAAYRLGGILVANQPAFMTIMWALVRPFMSAKMRSRVRLLGKDISAFATEMEPQLLPPEFGGSLQEDPMAWFDEQCALEAAGK